MKLEADEALLFETRPSVFSFWPFYFSPLYLAGVTTYFLVRKETLLSLFPLAEGLDSAMLLFYVLLAVALLLPAIIRAFISLSLEMPIRYGVILAASLYLKYKLAPEEFLARSEVWWIDNAELLLLLICALAMLVDAEAYRLSHKYTITTARVHTEAGVFSKRARTLFLSKINDFSLRSSLLGRVFKYGDLVPLTASGMGMGSNFASVGIEGGKKWSWSPMISLKLNAGHSMQVPKTRTHEALIGVPNAEHIHETLSAMLAKRELKEAAR